MELNVEYRFTSGNGYYQIFKCDKNSPGVAGTIVARATNKRDAQDMVDALNQAYKLGASHALQSMVEMMKENNNNSSSNKN